MPVLIYISTITYFYYLIDSKLLKVNISCFQTASIIFFNIPKLSKLNFSDDNKNFLSLSRGLKKITAMGVFRMKTFSYSVCCP